jgi:hypothetical protein
MRAICKVSGLIIIPRYSDSLFFKVTPFASYDTSYHPLLKNVLQTTVTLKFLASELPFHGWKSPEITWGEISVEFCVQHGKSILVEPH